MNNICMWQILVPAFWQTGEEIDVSTHRVWDRKVRDITRGLTINRAAKGHWVAPDGEVIVEKVIPVNFAATDVQRLEIMAMTCLFYQQQAVMCYKVGTDVVEMSYSLAMELMKDKSCCVQYAKDLVR